RMKSKLYKVLHPVLGRPMVQHVLDNLKKVQLDDVITIVGFGADQVMQQLGDMSRFAMQREQLGTANAVMQAEDLLKDEDGTTIMVCGYTLLISSVTYDALFDHHERSGAKSTILTTKAPDPTGYGRVVRNNDHEVERIVEHKDATDDERMIN